VGGVLSQDLTTVTVFMMEWKFEFWKMDYLDSLRLKKMPGGWDFVLVCGKMFLSALMDSLSRKSRKHFSALSALVNVTFVFLFVIYASSPLQLPRSAAATVVQIEFASLL